MTPEPAPRSRRLAQAAFVISLLGVCVFPVCAVGGVLAVVDWWKARGKPLPPGFDWSGWALRLNALSLAGSICLIPSLPMFWAEQQRSTQRECRELLVALHGRAAGVVDGGVSLRDLADTVPTARFRPYTYVFSRDVRVPAAKHAPDEAELQRQLRLVEELAHPGVRGECPACDVTIACVGNTDGDDMVDLLSISTARRWEYGLLEVEPGRVLVHMKDYPGDDKVPGEFAPRDGGP